MASVAAAATSGVIMDQKGATLIQEQQKQAQNQEPLRCPRCDSTNTKFCYYNNYSLSQPRHFCKGCKRYWTRGGTLRSVPVGGGCRKNKRVKRPPNSSSSTTNTSLSTNHHNASPLEGSVNSGASSATGGHIIHDLISSASNHGNLNPLFYGLPTNHSSEMINFPFSRYDLPQNPPQIDGLGLGFSSSGLVHNMNGDHHGDVRNNGLNINLENHLSSNSKQTFQDLISSNPLFSNYTTTTTTSCTNTPTISSLLASRLQMKGTNNTLLPSSYEDDSLHMKGNGGQGFNSEMFTKEVKMEYGGQNKSMNHHWSAPSQNQMDHNNMGSSSDPSVIWGSGPNLGAWLDASNNLGSSVTSLI